MNEEYFTAGLGAADDEVDIAMCEMDAEMADNTNNIWNYIFFWNKYSILSMHRLGRATSWFLRFRMRFVEMPRGKIVTWMQILKTKIFKWFFICEFRDKSVKMRDKEVKEKLLFKKDSNGKRYVYVSMGRFHFKSWQFLYGSVNDKCTYYKQ